MLEARVSILRLLSVSVQGAAPGCLVDPEAPSKSQGSIPVVEIEESGERGGVGRSRVEV